MTIRHLEAFGIPANELQSRTHKVPAQLPWAIAAPPSPTAASAAAASLVSELERMLEGIAGPSGPSEQASECIPSKHTTALSTHRTVNLLPSPPIAMLPASPEARCAQEITETRRAFCSRPKIKPSPSPRVYSRQQSVYGVRQLHVRRMRQHHGCWRDPEQQRQLYRRRQRQPRQGRPDSG